MPENDLLLKLLQWCVTGGGAGILSYWLMERVPQLAQLKAEHKRYASVALSAVLGAAAYAAAVGLSYQATPGTAQAWIEALVAAAGVATGLSQVIHGRRKLRA